MLKLSFGLVSCHQAAAALARAAAMHAAKEAKEKADKEVAEMELNRLREAFQKEQERMDAEGDNNKSSQQAKLKDRLAAKKQAKEAELRAKEDALKAELAERQRQQVAKLQQALELETISDDSAIKAAIGETMGVAKSQGMEGYGREIFVLEKVLARFTIPAGKMRQFVEMVMEERHSAELASLLSSQYREKSSLLRDTFNELFDRKARDRQSALDGLLSRGAGEDERLQALATLDEKYSTEQRALEQKLSASIDAEHIDAQLKLRSRQTTELVSAVRQMLPDDANKEIARLDAEQEEQRQLFAKEKDDRMQKIAEEKKRFEEELRRRHEEEIRKIEQENDELLRKEKEMQVRCAGSLMIICLICYLFLCLVADGLS